MDGASKAYVTYQPDLAVEGATEAITELSRLACEKGLERVVLLSGRGEPGAQRAEAALQASGVPWTIVRASWFNQNFSEGYLIDGVLAGEVALPAGAVPEPFVDVDDIADVVVAALADVRHANKLYELHRTARTHLRGGRERDRGGGGPADPVHADLIAGFRLWHAAGRYTGRGRRSAGRTLHRGARRPQLTCHAWRRGSAWPSGPRFFRLCPQHRGDRRLEGLRRR